MAEFNRMLRESCCVVVAIFHVPHMFSLTALSKHAVELGHSFDWKNYEILQIETDYHKCNFIESFYINSLSNVLNDKKSVCFPSICQNLFS